MGQRDKVGDERLVIGGPHPEYGAIRITVTISILHCCIGLADAPRSSKRMCLGDCSTVILGELLTQRGAVLHAARKEMVAPKRHVPERGGRWRVWRDITM